MGELGADPGQLRDLAAAMRAESRRTRESLARVAGGVRSVRWHGHDAERFKSVWSSCERVVGSATDLLDRAAEDLERNAGEQLRASDGHAATTAGPVAATGAASMRSTGGDPGPPPVGDPLPLRTETWEIGGALGAGLGASGTARITVTELPGGRMLVWLEDVDSVTAAVGAAVDVGVDNGPGLEIGADAGGELAVHTREGWYTDAEGLPWLLSRLGLREVMGAGIISPGVPSGPGGGLGVLLQGATDLLGLSAPEPATSEMLITLSATAGATAALGLPLASASGAVAQTVGTRARGDELSLVMGARVDGSAKVPGGRSSGARNLEIEIPLGGDSQHLIVTTTEEVPAGQVMDRRVYDFDGEEATRHMGHAAQAARSGDIDGAAKALEALWKHIELHEVWGDAVGGAVNDDVESLDVGAALGADLSGSVTGGRRIVTYQR